MAAPEAWRARSCWFCEVAAATTMEATSREAAPAKSSASGPSAPPALFELCGRAVSAHMGVLESGVWGKSRGEGLPLATSGGGPAAGGRGGRGREAWGKAQPGALEATPSGRNMNSVPDRAGQSKGGDQIGRWTRTAAWLGGAGGEARRPGLGPNRQGPGDRGCNDGPAVSTELTLGSGRAGECRMSNRRAGMAPLLGGGGRGWEARPKARRPGPGPPNLTDARGLPCLLDRPRVPGLRRPG